ncbi:MAG TPA: response regulator transcription factor [Phycisphaerae bacterium]|nr:response regulator transcription factor [Phycisphaerae bacterium]
MSRAQKTILVVEDEHDLAELICFNLEREGISARRAAAGDKAVAEIRRDPPDLILLDRMLPGMSGEEVAQEIRRDPATAGIPIIMLTAKAEESDELVGFALGADDYVTKPFSMKVLMARVTAMLRRGDAPVPDAEIFREGPFSLDWTRHELTVGEAVIAVTATEFRLMGALMAASGRVLDRGKLIDKVLGQGAVVLDRTIDVHITSLRKKLAAADPAADHAAWIQTVRGVGYSFRPPTAE